MVHRAMKSGRGGSARGSARLAARHRSRHVSVRDVEQHDLGRRRDRRRHCADGDRRRARRREGVHDARRHGPLPTEMDEAMGERVRNARQRVRRDDGPSAALRLVRRRRRSLCGAHQRTDRRRRDKARRARHARSDRDMHGLRVRRRVCTPSFRATSRARHIVPRYEWFEGWQQSTARRAPARGSAGARRARISTACKS